MVLGLVYLPGSVLVLSVRVSVVLYAGIDPAVAESVAAIATVFAVVVAAALAVADRKLAKPPVVVVC